MSNYVFLFLKKLDEDNISFFNTKLISQLLNWPKRRIYFITKYLLDNGFIFRLKKGFFVYKNNLDVGFKIYTAMYVPSYVSLWSALSYYGLTEQVPDKIQLVTTKHFRKSSNVTLYQLNKNLFVDIIDNGFPIAKKEKVIFDLIWFNAITKDSFLQVAKEINIKKVLKYVKFIPSIKKKKEMQKKIRWFFDKHK